jgi:hypothetical protein
MRKTVFLNELSLVVPWSELVSVIPSHKPRRPEGLALGVGLEQTSGCDAYQV